MEYLKQEKENAGAAAAQANTDITAEVIDEYLENLEDIKVFDEAIARALDTEEMEALKVIRQDLIAHTEKIRAKDPARFKKGDSLAASIRDGKMDHRYLLGDDETRKKIFSFSNETTELILDCVHMKTDALVNAIISDPDNDEWAVRRKLETLQTGMQRALYM